MQSADLSSSIVPRPILSNLQNGKTVAPPIVSAQGGDVAGRPAEGKRLRAPGTDGDKGHFPVTFARLFKRASPETQSVSGKWQFYES